MLTFPQKITILPQLVNIFPQKVMFPPKYVDLRAVVSCRESHLRAFCREIHQSANLGNARTFTAFETDTPP